jgi:transposase-like protein
MTDIVARGLDPARRRLFVIDGSKALRKAIDEVFGVQNPIQRCRNNKIRNVLDYLPPDRQETVRCAMKAAFLLPAEQGMAKLKKLSEWLTQEYPSAAESLREGLEEMFTINRLDLPSQLRRCLASTNIIESPNAGIREKTGRVTRWRDGQMVLRWTASVLVTLEKRMRRIMGHQQLWMLEAKLQEQNQEQGVARKVKSA